uniref:Variant surface glycoprotein n=1 Tax=Trypanosoma brucei TaxID=5691 RepID=A0A1V0G0B1_9TRYP|nr:variant surface glycoprotein [Trypanosoma brucei]
MEARCIVTVISILAISIIPPAQPADGGALLKGQWSPLAKLSEALAKVPARATKLLSDRSAHINKLIKLKLQADLYLETDKSNTTQKLWLPITEAIAAEISDLASTIAQKETEAIKVVTTTEFLRGHIAEFFTVALGAFGNTNVGCITTVDNGDATGAVVTKLSDSQTGIPATDLANLNGGEAELDGITGNGFTGLKTTTGISNNGMSDDANCVLFKASTNGVTSTAPIAQTLYFAAGYFGRAATAAATTEADATDFSTSGAGTKNSKLKLYKAAYDEITKMLPGTKFKGTILDPKNIASLKANRHFKAAVKRVLLAKDDAYTPADDENINNKIDAIYKTDNTEFLKLFWDKLKEQKIPKAAAGVEDTNIDALTTLTELNRAISYYRGKTQADLEAKVRELQNKETKSAEDKDKECKKIEKAELCKEKQPKCEWKNKDATEGPHCQLNETNVAKQATQTGSTGEQTSKCTGLDSKDKCEAVQGTPAPGKKSVCGWITYEDDKGTLEKPYCRDSSFLLTKKFALSVVSAAFVALLF